MTVLTRSAASSILNGERSVTDRARRYNARCNLKSGSMQTTSAVTPTTTAENNGNKGPIGNKGTNGNKGNNRSIRF